MNNLYYNYQPNRECLCILVHLMYLHHKRNMLLVQYIQNDECFRHHSCHILVLDMKLNCHHTNYILHGMHHSNFQMVYCNILLDLTKGSRSGSRSGFETDSRWGSRWGLRWDSRSG